MNDTAEHPGAIELVSAMRQVRDDFHLNSVAITQWLPGGQLLTVTVLGDMVTFETEDHTQVRF